MTDHHESHKPTSLTDALQQDGKAFVDKFIPKSQKAAERRAEIARKAKEVGKRVLPIAGVASLVIGTGAYLIGQTTTAAHEDEEKVESIHEANKEQDAFLKLLDDAATEKEANLSDVIPGSTIIDPGNQLYSRALEFAKAQGLDYSENGVDTILETAVAISKAGYVQPDSIFVVSKVDVDQNGTDEVIVQRAPDLPTESTSK
jgi:hypothetical protein